MDSKSEKVCWPGWQVARKIGSGSFGAVYEIRREVHGRVERAALKVISIPQDNSEIAELRAENYSDESITKYFADSLDRIENEYAVMVDMKGHANVVYCEDLRKVQHENGFGWDIYIKMELLTPLKQHLSTKMTDEQVIRFGIDMCNALMLCKQLNIIHRDIKPENIFVTRDGSYKLGDFGIARTMEKTSGGTKTGTYDYMAPEVYNNWPYHLEADIYSLGLVMYWMLNNWRLPFIKDSAPTGSEKQMARERRFSGESIPAPQNGSTALKKIVLKACAYKAKDRYLDPAEMKSALEALLYGRLTYTKPNEGSREQSETGTVRRINTQEDNKTVASVSKKESTTNRNGIAGNNASHQSGAPVRKKRKGWILGIAVVALVAIVMGIVSGQKTPKQQETIIMNGDSLEILVDSDVLEEKENSESVRETPIVVQTEPEVEESYTVQHEPVLVAQEPLPLGYQLTEIGIISDPDADIGFLSLDNTMVLREANEENQSIYKILNEMGEVIYDEAFASVDAVGEDTYVVSRDSDEANNTGLITNEGEVLIPFDAAFIEPLTNYDVSDEESRYLQVTYSTGVTENEEEAFFYVSNSYSLFGPEDGDVLHTGYARVYDLENRCFVGDIVLTNPGRTAVEHCGDYFAVDDGDKIRIYDEVGKATLEFSNMVYLNCGYNYVTVSDGGETRIYDCAGDVLYSTDKSITIISGSNEYVYESSYNDGVRTQRVMDIYGNAMFEVKDGSVYQEAGGLFRIEQNGKNVLVDITGKEVFASEESLGYDGFGCWHYSKNSGEASIYGLVLPNGNTVEQEEFFRKLNVAKKWSDGFGQESGYDFFVLNDGDYTLSLECESKAELKEALVYVSHDYDKGLYDLFSGEELLPMEYQGIQYSNGNIYAYKDGVWTVYELILIY